MPYSNTAFGVLRLTKWNTVFENSLSYIGLLDNNGQLYIMFCLKVDEMYSLVHYEYSSRDWCKLFLNGYEFKNTTQLNLISSNRNYVGGINFATCLHAMSISGYLYWNPYARVRLGITFCPSVIILARSSLNATFSTNSGIGIRAGRHKARPNAFANSLFVTICNNQNTCSFILNANNVNFTNYRKCPEFWNLFYHINKGLNFFPFFPSPLIAVYSNALADTFNLQFTNFIGCQYQSVFKYDSPVFYLVGTIFYITVFYDIIDMSIECVPKYEGWNFSSGNYLFTTGTK